jgi:uncharacterized membrane protein
VIEDVFKEFAGYVALGIEAIGVVVIAIGTIEAIVAVVRIMLGTRSPVEKRGAWMRYARWLVAGLTFQLAGDIVHSAIAPTWDEIGRLAAIAVIRTFLTYFLDRDIDQMRDLKEWLAAGTATTPPS